MRAGDEANRSPLRALAKMNPLRSTFDQNPGPGRLDPLPHADTNLAIPTTSQYPKASAIVPANMYTALPYGEFNFLGLNVVVSMSKHNIS